MKNPFTVEQGIEVQTNQLRRWKSILKSDKYLLLYEFATSSNVDAKTGYDVMRGVTLDNWIHNNLMSDDEAINLDNENVEIDLFENISELPQHIQDVISKYPTDSLEYFTAKMFLEELELVGYTFDYQLDGIPFNLRKL